jgi:hypothetical protein
VQPAGSAPEGSTNTPSPIPDEEGASSASARVLRGGGIALAYPAPNAANQTLLMRPVMETIHGAWEAIIASNQYQELRNQLGCVDMVLVKPDDAVGPVSLAYSVPAVGSVITPTTWSEYSLYEETAEGLDRLPITQTLIVASEPFMIDQVQAIMPTVACGDRRIRAEISDWSQQIGSEQFPNLDRLLVTAVQPDGSTKQVLIIVNPPQSGAGCEAAKTACERCDGCAYGWVCTVVSWVCS